MSSLRTFAGLSSSERGLILRALLVVALIRVALWVMPFQRLRRLTTRDRLPINIRPGMPISSIVWAVKAASRRVPTASCLTQSLALQCLLARAGYESQICIGVAKNPEIKFQAHAWVECGGQELLSSSSEDMRYVEMLTMGDKVA